MGLLHSLLLVAVVRLNIDREWRGAAVAFPSAAGGAFNLLSKNATPFRERSPALALSCILFYLMLTLPFQQFKAFPETFDFFILEYSRFILNLFILSWRVLSNNKKYSRKLFYFWTLDRKIQVA